MPGQLSNQIPSSIRVILEQDSDGAPVNLNLASSEVSEKAYVYTSILGED